MGEPMTEGPPPEVISFLADDARSDHSAMLAHGNGAAAPLARDSPSGWGGSSTAGNSEAGAVAAAPPPPPAPLAKQKSRMDSGVSELWTVDFSELGIQKQIGEGSFGKVGHVLEGRHQTRQRGGKEGCAVVQQRGGMPCPLCPPRLASLDLHTPLCLPLSCPQVYLAKWRETTVAVKVLGSVGSANSTGLDDEFPDSSASLKLHPLYESLQKVGAGRRCALARACLSDSRHAWPCLLSHAAAGVAAPVCLPGSCPRPASQPACLQPTSLPCPRL